VDGLQTIGGYLQRVLDPGRFEGALHQEYVVQVVFYQQDGEWCVVHISPSWFQLCRIYFTGRKTPTAPAARVFLPAATPVV
jgi:hypothetical protein